MRVIINEPDGLGTETESIQIDRWDTWSMDHTLGMIALPMLKQLKETKHGAPNVDSGDVPPELRCNDMRSKAYWTNGETDEKFFDRWDYVLDEMIFAFETKCGDLIDWEDQFYQTDSLPNYESVGIGPAQLRLFPDEDGSMEDYELYEFKSTGESAEIDWEGLQKFQKRISNGFRLFGKYYESLWD